MRQSFTKTLTVFALIGFFLLGDFALAQQSLVIDETTMTTDFAEVIDIIIGVLSWGRVLIANLAGKLMTNEFVYGEFINLDSVLLQMWNVAKNFANFGLGFFFMYHIFKYFFSNGDGINKIGGILMKIIVAAIGIQMSWFLVGAVLDIAAVMTTAVSSFPNAILEQNFQDQEQLINTIKEVPTKITLKTQADISDRSIAVSSEKLKDTELTTAEYLDFIVPAPDDLSGPLYYVGFSALRIQDYMTLTLDAPSGEKPIGLLVTIILKFGILLAFTLALILLAVINIFRIVYLWLFIAFSPILILLRAVGSPNAISDGGIKNFNLGQIIKLIFTPVIYVAYLGIMLITIVTMQKILLNSTALDTENCNQNIDGVKMCYDQVNKKSSLVIDDINSGITVEGEIFPPSFQDASANIFTSILISIFTLLLLWGLVRLMTSSGSDIGRSTLQSTVQSAKTIATSVPIVPLAGGQSIASLQQAANRTQREIRTNAIKKSQAGVDNFEQQLNQFLNLETGMTSSDREQMRYLATAKNDVTGNSSKYLNKAKEVISRLPEYSMKTSSDSITGDLNGWFTVHKDKIANIGELRNRPGIKKAFAKSKDVKDVATFVESIDNRPDKEFFLNWLHKQLGGKGGEMYTWKQFIETPIKAKRA